VNAIDNARYVLGDEGNFNWIDTTKITSMRSLSESLLDNNFNGHIELWNTRNVTDMSNMFY
jgi:hypothetical protein